MKKSSAFLAALALALLIQPLSVQASIIYNWTGDCQRILFGSDTLCTHASLHVVTTDAYIPGEEFSPHFPLPSPVLLEFLYSDDSNVTYDLAPPWLFDSGTFVLPASLPGAALSRLLLTFSARMPKVAGDSRVRKYFRTATG